MADLYKYATAVHMYKPMVKRAVVDFAVGADWTPAAGDVKISIDGGAAANVTNLPVAIAMGNTAMWDFSLTSGELTGKKIRVTVADSATKAVEDTMFEIDTYGNASAQHVIDLTDGVRAGLTALPNAAAEAAGGLYTRGTGAGQVNQDANGRLDTNTAAWKGTVVVATNTGGVPVVDTRRILRQGTAQAGAAGTITLDSGASATDNLYAPCRVTIISGTGAGQTRVGVSYVGSTKVLTVVGNWTTNPSTDSIFQLEGCGVDVEAWLRAAPSALTSGKVVASADLVTWLGSAPAALVGDAVKASVSAISNGAITAASIATDAVDADALSADALAEITAAVRAMVVETNNAVTLQQVLSVIYAFVAGITSGGGTTIKEPTGTAARIVATIDASNNRTAMTVTPSA